MGAMARGRFFISRRMPQAWSDVTGKLLPPVWQVCDSYGLAAVAETLVKRDAEELAANINNVLAQWRQGDRKNRRVHSQGRGHRLEANYPYLFRERAPRRPKTSPVVKISEASNGSA